MKWKVSSFIGLLVVLTSLVLWPQPLTEEQKVRMAIYEVEKGVEESNLGVVMGSISTAYRDENGLGHSSIKGYLFQQFRKRGPVHLQISPIEVVMKTNTAEASFQVAFSESEREGLLSFPRGSDTLHFDVQLSREEEEWKIVSHKREYVFESE